MNKIAYKSIIGNNYQLLIFNCLRLIIDQLIILSSAGGTIGAPLLVIIDLELCIYFSWCNSFHHVWLALKNCQIFYGTKFILVPNSCNLWETNFFQRKLQYHIVSLVPSWRMSCEFWLSWYHVWAQTKMFKNPILWFKMLTRFCYRSIVFIAALEPALQKHSKSLLKMLWEIVQCNKLLETLYHQLHKILLNSLGQPAGTEKTIRSSKDHLIFQPN